MVFLTNKPIEQILPKGGKRCQISAFPLEGLLTKDFTTGVVIDVTQNSGVINSLLAAKKPQWMRGNVELSQNNTVYVIQEALKNVLELVF